MLQEEKNVTIERSEGMLLDPSDYSDESFLTLDYVASSIAIWESRRGRWKVRLRRAPDADKEDCRLRLQECTESLAKYRRLQRSPVVVQYRLDSRNHSVADYVLPRKTLQLVGSGVFWPIQADPLFRLTGVFSSANWGLVGGFPTSDHRSVWIDVTVPAAD